MPKNKEEKEDIQQNIIQKCLDSNPRDHFNYIKPVTYKISTGSLTLDLELEGGIPNSIIRCAGMAEAGKSSFSLNIMRNFLLNKKRRGLYFVSDKDLTPNIIERCGVKFVTDVDNWEDGTCYIIRTNVYEMVCNTIGKLLDSRTNEKEYCFILDCMDNFAPKSALEEENFGDAKQKGGTGAISSHFFQKYNQLLPLLGHMAIMISQFRDSIIIGAQKQPTYKQMNTSGGRSIEHAAAWAFQFEIPQNSKEDMFWEAEPYKSKKIGHNCIIRFKKSTNEKTGNIIKYPIIYGRSNGNSIWIEKEIYNMMLFWGHLKSKGAGWLEFDKDFFEELKKVDETFPTKIQGEDTLIKILESKPKVVEFLYKKYSFVVN